MELKVRKSVVLTPSQIEVNLSGELEALYYLTPKLASRWESLMNADWNRYVCIFYTYTESGEGSKEVICPNQQFIEKDFTIDCYARKFRSTGSPKALVQKIDSLTLFCHSRKTIILPKL